MTNTVINYNKYVSPVMRTYIMKRAQQQPQLAVPRRTTRQSNTPAWLAKVMGHQQQFPTYVSGYENHQLAPAQTTVQSLRDADVQASKPWVPGAAPPIQRQQQPQPVVGTPAGYGGHGTFKSDLGDLPAYDRQVQRVDPSTVNWIRSLGITPSMSEELLSRNISEGRHKAYATASRFGIKDWAYDTQHAFKKSPLHGIASLASNPIRANAAQYDQIVRSRLSRRGMIDPGSVASTLGIDAARKWVNESRRLAHLHNRGQLTDVQFEMGLMNLQTQMLTAYNKMVREYHEASKLQTDLYAPRQPAQIPQPRRMTHAQRRAAIARAAY